jgi:hypothetical protein
MLSTTIRLAGRKIHIVRQMSDCDGCENHAAHARLEARSFLQNEITGGAYGDASALAAFRDLASADGLSGDVSRVLDSEVLGQIGWLLDTGRLIAVECRILALATPMVGVEAPKPGPRPRLRPTVVDAPVKTWVAIELLDDAGHPIANEKYVVTVPEGDVKSGQLDAQGRARIADIDPGTCKISFPDLHGQEWK